MDWIEWLLLGVAAPLGVVALVALLTYLMPHRFVRLVVGLWCRTFYRIRVEGLENVPAEGPVLVTPNHISWLDGIFVQLVSPRMLRMVVYAPNIRPRWLQWLAAQWGTIMMVPTPKGIARALKEANEGLAQGDAVCIFPEGAISRTGNRRPYKEGVMRIIRGLDVPVVPVYLGNLWGSLFSFDRGRFFWKMPRNWRYPVTIRFGRPLYNVQHVDQIRLAVNTMEAELMMENVEPIPVLPREAIRQCKRRLFQSKIADSMGADLSGGQTLMRALILRRLLRRHVLGPDERNVGVLLPPSVPGVLTNFALALDHRVAINLNYTVSSTVLNGCLERAGVRHVLTSRKVMEKLDLELEPELVYLEDLRGHLRWQDKVSAALAAYLTPSRIVVRQLGWHRASLDEILTIIFTSGSTGTPKGVVLSLRNVGSNVQAVQRVIHLRRDDVIVGILPFFHSFGYTITLWTALSLDIKGAYHFTPLDARPIAKLARQHRATILLATPTFLRNYLRRWEPEDIGAIDTVVAGAEKLPKELADAFEKKFGVRPVEGYGTTELSPLVSVNIPPSRRLSDQQPDLKEGSVGRAVPGVAARIVDLETGEDLRPGEPGMLLIRGPNVMQGYWKDPEKTAAVMRDGWYVTGDVAVLDEEGFIHITGRESRFSKIGGEMVPHGVIEEELSRIVGADPDAAPQIAVTAVPDEKKGERLIVLHTPLGQSPEQLCEALRKSGLPNLYIPSSDAFIQVDEIPVLGTGKLDLRRIREIAAQEVS